MAIIVIGQQLGSRGLALGQLVANRLSYRLISSTDVLASAARQYNVTAEQLQLVDERLPHFWERLRADIERLYISYRAMLLKELKEDRIVAVGRATPLFVPPDAHHILRVRAVAPLEHRVREVSANEGLDDAAAERRIRDYDREVRARLQAMLGVDIDDAVAYHLVINTASMPIASLAEILADAAHQAEREASTECRRRLRDASITAQVRASLRAHPKIGHAPIEVETFDGVVKLTSAALVPPWDKLANEVVSQIDGVVSIELGVEEPPIPPRAA